MNLEREIENRKRDLLAAIESAERAGEKTQEVLDIANELGVKTVGIGRRHASLGNADHPFAASGNIFTPQGGRVDGWPSAWRIAERAGISTGCDNAGQHQIPDGSCIDGVYRCVKGVWTRIEGER